MAYLSDIEIARAASKLPIQEIGAKLGISTEDLLPYGHDKAKVSQRFIDSVQDKKNGKLILVTAINPTPAGEGKTTTTVGLGDGLNRIGKQAVVCIREASLGPCFGMKGGAAGGGYALPASQQRVPATEYAPQTEKRIRSFTVLKFKKKNGKICDIANMTHYQ